VSIWSSRTRAPLASLIVSPSARDGGGLLRERGERLVPRGELSIARA
jgi:hypothetical protein